MTDLMSLESQTSHIMGQFSKVYPKMTPTVVFTPHEEIVVSDGPIADPSDPDTQCPHMWIMTIGSDDEYYTFELWVEGRDTGIYLRFGFPGEPM